MDGLSIFLLVLILIGFLVAIRSIWRKKDNPCGSCSGGCSSCSYSCTPLEQEKRLKELGKEESE
ncbi:FeoB-associated Cys-rich membrane protein [Desulfitobacterium dichloroeliminans]|uniref:FeoB-associated Cys-rich membrane protein n=1 Tax=Desulfitobacterium dichloroeliminans TaxID=233055 RepID=UPI0002FECBFB|nr:FeoB-associated Cys-rich membrane protein [Desulfitobacterium dichloroeliminans]